MSDLKSLLSVYQILGTRIPTWTQGQGSNLSYKDLRSKRLWIKPSGYRLQDVKNEKDLVEIDLELLPKKWDQLSQNEYAKVIQEAAVGATAKRASMETGFHAVLQDAYVLHFHSLVSILMGSKQENAKKWLAQNWTHGNFYFLEYVTPGLDLTVEISKNSDGSLFFLKQHGVILAGPEPSVLDAWLEIEKKWMAEFYGVQWPLELSDQEIFSKFSTGSLKVLFPDMAVYLRQMPQVLENGATLLRLKADFESNQRNLVELWVATQILLEFEKDLPEISWEEIQKISGLPTEQYRKLRNFEENE